jgi:hypothetical protein
VSWRSNTFEMSVQWFSIYWLNHSVKN